MITNDFRQRICFCCTFFKQKNNVFSFGTQFFTSVFPFISIILKKISFNFPNSSTQFFQFVVTNTKSSNIFIKNCKILNLLFLKFTVTFSCHCVMNSIDFFIFYIEHFYFLIYFCDSKIKFFSLITVRIHFFVLRWISF